MTADIRFINKWDSPEISNGGYITAGKALQMVPVKSALFNGVFYDLLNFLKLVQRQFPGIKVICTGINFTLNPLFKGSFIFSILFMFMFQCLFLNIIFSANVLLKFSVIPAVACAP